MGNYGSLLAGLTIREAKTATSLGELQFVKVTCPYMVGLLYKMKREKCEKDLVVDHLPYSAYLRAIKEVAVSFGFPNAKFSPHSARIGAATDDYIRGCPIKDIALKGR